ncbi:MAG: hemerythrin domain-containing protein [Nocardia sp.]|nr:hemerythrin domain-containing protein [Nocardia sp.]
MRERTEGDVVALLTAQHERISQLLKGIHEQHGDRSEQLDELVRLLAVHETAEEEVVHRAARRAEFGAEQMVNSRLAEENHAKQALSELYDLGVDSDEFDGRFDRFALALTEHAAQEEAAEFPLLRQQFSETQLRRLADSVRLAESLAPTRPHPMTGASAVANMVAGPPLAVFDRVRDLLRDHGR